MKLGRRKFIALSMSSVLAMEALGQLAKAGASDKPVAAVLESTDENTLRMTGAEIMLKRAGFQVISITPDPIAKDLSVNSMIMNYEDKAQREAVLERKANPRYTFSVGPDITKIDLLFFGTFTNGEQPYHDYMRRYGNQIPAFVSDGGIVVEMSQWGKYSFLYPDFLPGNMKIVRETWSGTDELILTDKQHPLMSKWLGNGAVSLQYPKPMHQPGRIYDGRRSWESIAEWEGMRLLIGAGGGYRKSKNIPGRGALVESQHGKGRYLLSSLWLDKLFDDKGEIKVQLGVLQASEGFFRSLFDYTVAVKNGKAVRVQPTVMAPDPIIGPVLGHIDHEQAIIWIRGNRAGTYSLTFWKEGQDRKDGSRLQQAAAPESDLCVKWRITGLKPGTKYLYTFSISQSPMFDNRSFSFKTSTAPLVPAVATIAFGSCVDMNGRFGELWEQIDKHGCEGMVLLGDTPYIDSTQIIHQRIKHRNFFLHEGPAALSKKIPFWGTWDDHDFGANDSDGGIHNRSNTRRVFQEYRPLVNYGENGEGIYTQFRRGPIEVFLLDTRYFAGTENSFASADKPTLIGRAQWEWLKRVLKASTAPVKILACGMTWDAKLTAATTRADCWDRYVYEREALIDYLGKEKITQALLVGGDIHCTQVMKYSTEDRIGYPLYHIVTSPMHERVIRENEALQHPGMLFNRAEPNTFLKITADTRVEPFILTADIIDITGQSIYRLVIGGE